nr:unnamed protein product [Digitaria exilis]
MRGRGGHLSICRRWGLDSASPSLICRRPIRSATPTLICRIAGATNLSGVSFLDRVAGATTLSGVASPEAGSRHRLPPVPVAAEEKTLGSS